LDEISKGLDQLKNAIENKESPIKVHNIIYFEKLKSEVKDRFVVG
jgi:hypothetical protein